MAGPVLAATIPIAKATGKIIATTIAPIIIGEIAKSRIAKYKDQQEKNCIAMTYKSDEMAKFDNAMVIDYKDKTIYPRELSQLNATTDKETTEEVEQNGIEEIEK